MSTTNPSGAMANAIVGGQLASVQRGVKRFGSVLSPPDLMRSLGGIGGQTTAALNTGGMSLDLSGTGGVLGEFDFGFKRDAAGNAYAPPLQEAYDPINARVVPTGRRYVALGFSHLGHKVDAIAPPGEKQLALIYRTPPSSRNVQMDDGATIMGDPAIAGTPLTVNYSLAILQAQWARENIEAYRNLTPSMLWFGCPTNRRDVPDNVLALKSFDQYRGFAFDAVVRITESSHGGAPMVDNGLQMRKGGGLFGSNISRMYDPTVVTKGQQQTLDYAGGEGVVEGARCYMILKKYSRDNYARPPGEPNKLWYCLAEKDVDSIRDGQGMYRELDLPVMAAGGAICPFQLSFYNSPDGSPIDPYLLSYVDEWGVRHFDGIAIPYGRIFAAPHFMYYKPPPTEPDALAPYMNGRGPLTRGYLELLVDTDNGIGALL